MEIFTFRGYYLHFAEISMFRGYYPHFLDISALRGYYPHFMDISKFHGYYLHLVDTIGIGQTKSYLACNFCHVTHSLVLVVDFFSSHYELLSSSCLSYLSHFTLLVKVTGATIDLPLLRISKKRAIKGGGLPHDGTGESRCQDVWDDLCAGGAIFFLFGLETGVVMLHNLKLPKSLHNQVAWRIYGRVTQRYRNGSWLYPQIGYSLVGAVLGPVGD